MLEGDPHQSFGERSLKNVYGDASSSDGIQQLHPLAFDIHTAVPPPTDPLTIMQRADEVNTIQRMLSDAQTSAVVLIGNPGAGKSTLAALLYNRLLLSKQQGLPAPHHLIWLGIGTYTTLPDLFAAILTGLNVASAGFFLLKPDQQAGVLLQALRRPQENALIVLDQFESLLHPEVSQGVAGRGALALFLEMLQTDLGASRFLLTSYSSPYNEEMETTRVRSCLVSRMSIPEGVALLQRRSVQGSPEELSLVWQRCAGHVFALILFNALVSLSGISLSYLLNSPDYQPLWSGEVTLQLINSVYQYLNPVQYALMRTLGLFNEPVPLEGIIMSLLGKNFGDRSFTPEETFAREIAVLTRLSLVQSSSNARNITCYMLHPMLRQYMLENYLADKRRSEELASLGVDVSSNLSLNGPEALQVALAAGHLQVAEYYLHVARTTCPTRVQRKSLQDVQSLVSAIRHLCLGGYWQRACDLLFEEGLHECMLQWGAWNTLIGLYTSLLPPFGMLVRRDEVLVYSHIAMLYGRMSEYQQSQSYFQQALSIQHQLSDYQGEMTILINQGELYRLRGEYEQAQANFEQALLLLEELKKPQLHCILLHNLGLLYQGKKDYSQAQKCYLEALRIASTLPGQHDKGMILTNLGMLLYEQGEHLEGVALLLVALHIRQGLQDSTVISLETFLLALEQRMGQESYLHMCQEAVKIQSQVLSRFVPVDMRQ
ncbi:MAG: ATP-binding protein [Ktedonobacteraceae bacterium]|nr:ATP-binding protein [Ktedonobacteraceae bacterium]